MLVLGVSLTPLTGKSEPVSETPNIGTTATLPALQHLPINRFSIQDANWLNQRIRSTLKQQSIPGAVVLIGQGRTILYWQAFGFRQLVPHQQPMTVDTLFDLASLTKVVATTPAIMQLVAQHRLDLDAPVSRYWPEFAQQGKGAITLRMLLTHTSGLRAGLYSTQDWHSTSAALGMVLAERPLEKPGSHFRYSDINFIVLAHLVTLVSGEPFDQYCQRHLFQPLGMTDTTFRPLRQQMPDVASNEITQPALPGLPVDRTPAVIEVNDPTAARMGGIAGHAGLFSTAGDLALYAQWLVAETQQNKQLEQKKHRTAQLQRNVRSQQKERSQTEPVETAKQSVPGAPVLSPDMVATMLQSQVLPGGKGLRTLGWDRASPYAKGYAENFGPHAFGHTGFTGTLIWIDPDSQVYVIVLANPLHPAGQGRIRPLRQLIAQFAGRLCCG